MDQNFNKNELNIKGKIKNKKNIAKSKSGDVKQNNTNVEGNVTINQQFLLSPEQLSSLLPNAIKQVSNSILEELRYQDYSLLKKSFETINPAFFVANATKENAKIQVQALIANNANVSLRRQAIAKLAFLTQEDLLIFQIICQIRVLVHKLFDSFKEDNSKMILKNELYNVELLGQVALINSLMLKHSINYGNLSFDKFETLLAEGLLKYDGNEHSLLKMDKLLQWEKDNNSNLISSIVKILNKIPNGYASTDSEGKKLYWYCTNLAQFLFELLLKL